MSFFGTTDFFLEVGKGNITGHELVTVVMRNELSTGNLEDIWSGGGVMTYPTSAETWEIVSTSANDSSAGTGMRTARVVSLDANFDIQENDVTLNGLTPVTIAGTHIAPRSVFILTQGPGGKNDGAIIVRVAGGGATRNYIVEGFNNSHDGHYTVPAGKTLFKAFALPYFSKNHSGIVRPRYITNTVGGEGFIGSEIPFYQNGREIVLSFQIPEKTNITFETESQDPGAQIICPTRFLQVDNSVLPGGFDEEELVIS
ncbi:MAG: hypothetical protein V3R25_09205 [Nitrosomonadaceae bacterium]